MKRTLPLVTVLTVIISMLIASSGYATFTQRQSRSEVLTDSIVGKPTVNNRYIFWLDDIDGNMSIKGFDFVRGVKINIDQIGHKWDLTSNSTQLAWVSSTINGDSQINLYDISSRTAQVFYETTAYISNLAMSDSHLYFQDGTEGSQGLFAIDLLSQEKELVSSVGQRPVTHNGILLWSELVNANSVYLPIVQNFGAFSGRLTASEEDSGMYPELNRGTFTSKEWVLRLRTPSQTTSSTVIARSKGSFSSYNISGDTVVWSSLPPAEDLRVFSYSISTQTVNAVSQGWATNPVIQGTEVVWTNHPEQEVLGTAKEWSLQQYSAGTSLSNGSLVSQGTAQTEPIAITASKHVIFLAYTNGDTGRPSLHITNLYQSALSLNSVSSGESQLTAVSGGQITKTGRLLYDNGVRWKMKGVMFLLPNYGINHLQFQTSNYNSSTAARAYWLDMAGPGWLNANTVRIFVEMNSSTSPDTVYNFALEADAKNMRVGVVLKNYADFAMTTARRQWLNDMIKKFRDNNKLHLIAYVSAHNEINNPTHCNSTTDCYDRTDKTYMTNANSWVFEFNKVFKDANSGILTTVGLTTEGGDADGQPAVYNFFKPDNNNRKLADLVDFISPHNYGGGGYGIIQDIQSKGYTGPVVLEEFGFPTDNVTRNSSYTEGNAACRSDPGFPTSSPNYNLCKLTAPYYVEMNARALRDLTNDYAGGVSWMLADMNSKPCSGSGYAPDNFTGLFSVGGTYCGGTTSTATTPDDKATAFRILTHHTYY